MTTDPRSAAAAAVMRWLEWAARDGRLEVSRAPVDLIVDAVIQAYAAALVPDAAGWFPIESLPEGQHVELYWPDGERGVGGIECATVFRNGLPFGGYSYWTHGGPNSGSDWEPANGEFPTHWRPIRPGPARIVGSEAT